MGTEQENPYPFQRINKGTAGNYSKNKKALEKYSKKEEEKHNNLNNNNMKNIYHRDSTRS